jgi:Fe-S cluster assembly protein SufD
MAAGGRQRMTAAVIDSKQLARVVEALSGDALGGARSAALQRFLESGLPTRRDEDWKYSDLSRLVETSNQWLAGGPGDAIAHDEIKAMQSRVDADWLVFSNGRLQRGYSNADSIDGVAVDTLSSVRAADRLRFPLTDLNAALLQEGYLVKIAAGAELERPLAILVADGADSATLAQSRVDIDAGAGSRSQVVEVHVSTGTGELWSNNVVNLDIGADATLEYLRLQLREPGHDQTAQLNVALGAASEFRHFGLDLGSRLVRNDLRIDIAERRSTARFDGLYIAGDGQHFDNHTRADHRVGPAVSQQEYRGILGGKARCVWNGKAIVHTGADGTDAMQANHNLLLSEGAEIDAKPELEIYADDVKCSHGTTVGQLDERALYYLRTRGLDAARARRVLTRAFATAVIEHCPIDALREFIAVRVEDRLAGLSQETSS